VFKIKLYLIYRHKHYKHNSSIDNNSRYLCPFPFTWINFNLSVWFTLHLCRIRKRWRV